MKFVNIRTSTCRPKNSGEKDINCTPFTGTAKKPSNLLAMEAESFKLRHEQFLVSIERLNITVVILSVPSDLICYLKIQPSEPEKQLINYHVLLEDRRKDKLIAITREEWK